MILKSSKASLAGEALIPSSKSHTIRALAFATLASGESTIRNPLDSADTRACIDTCRALGAEIEADELWSVKGTGGVPKGGSDQPIDVKNSGTTLRVAMSMAALGETDFTFTGDHQIQSRPAQPLLDALVELGAEAESLGGNGCAPLRIRGPLRGGHTQLACPTSQYLTSLLIATPLAPEDTEIEVSELNEAPYVEITLEWLNRLGITYAREGMARFHVTGRQRYLPFAEAVGGDFSSATFFLCAAAITGSELVLRGLNMNDAQGDKAVVRMLQQMGCVTEPKPRALRIRGGALKGMDIDMNATPDALPAMAITACFAEGTTRLLNVPQARIKECDRIAVMREVITDLGGRAEELPDGLVIHGGGLKGGRAHGHDDHRVVMACGLAGLVADTPVQVDTAEAAAVTFPTFTDLMNSVGAKMEVVEA